MASSVTPSAQSVDITHVMTTSSTLRAPAPPDSNENADDYHTVLLVIYSVVLLGGTISLSLMMHMMKSSMTSTTSIAVLNLVFTHFIFLLTVPFRLYYYASNYWKLGLGWCRLVSMMIHTHMYMSFIFYVIILMTRLITFYYKAERETSFNRIHALLVSVVVWVVVLVVVPCILFFTYGQNTEKAHSGNSTTGETHCFRFGKNIESAGKVFIVVSIALTALQANVLWVLYRKHQNGCTFQQDFGAQLKSLCFALIMMVCFVPYHIFRLSYLENVELQNINEVFLSLTTFNCLDMLTFLRNRTCYMCLLGKKW